MRTVLNGLVATHESHTEHVPPALLNWILNELKGLAGGEFRIIDMEVPAGLSLPTRNLIGPSCGDAPVEEDGGMDVYRGIRSGAKDRVWESRLIKMLPPQTRWFRIICCPMTFKVDGAGVVREEVGRNEVWEGPSLTLLVLATAYGIGREGEPTAPPEPGDPDIQPGGRLWREGIKEESEAFWAVHALCAPK